MSAVGIPKARGRYDVVGASEGTDLGSIDPDSASVLLRALATHLDKMTGLMLANTQGKTEQVEFDVDAANIPAGGFSVKLPTGSAISGYYVENNSANVVTVLAGTSPSGRWLNTIAGQSYKSSPMPQQITSLCVVASGSAVGLVRVLISTSNLGPSLGSTVGTAASPPTSNVTTTTPTITTTQTQIVAANPARVGLTIYNSGGTNGAQIGFNTLSGYNIIVAPFATYSFPYNYKGSLSAFTFSGTTGLVITEFS